MSPIKNYTTEVPESRTVSEILGLLAEKGARSVHIDYDDQGRPSAISFTVIVMQVPIPFLLPCDFDGVFKYMAANYKDRHSRRRFENNPNSMPQARRIAWRILKDWVAAQMAMIEAGQASLPQVFLPYVKMVQAGGQTQTLYEKFLTDVSRQKALPAGDPIAKEVA